MSPQNQAVLKYLLRNKSITSLEAIHNLGVMSLPKRICELQSEYRIEKKSAMVPTRYGKEVRVTVYWYGGKRPSLLGRG